MGCSCASTGGRATCAVHGGLIINGPTTMMRLACARYEPTLTEDECVKHGGHCFESTGEVLTSDPPQYPETCKHCGKRRIGTPRSPMEYRDA